MRIKPINQKERSGTVSSPNTMKKIIKIPKIVTSLMCEIEMTQKFHH
jgi:hypothetical protein